MKNLIHILNFRIVILFFGFQNLMAMKILAQPADHDFNTISLEIAWNKTTSVIFPEAIKNVDRGSRDILAQKVKGVENILQLKAGKTDFPETNLTVITGEGKLYHFMVNYSNHPEELIIEIGKPETANKKPVIFNSTLTESQLSQYSSSIIASVKKGKMVSQSKYKVSLALKGIYIQDDALFYHLQLENRSNIDYDINFLKFYIRDKKRLKRTATQETEVNPLYIHGDDTAIKSNSELNLVYVLKKFTIPDARFLAIELYEKNGGRQLDLSVKNRMIMMAKPIPENN